MNYLKALKLIREPFANTPDPEFFYDSGQHLGCLQRLEISIRLRRGLNVVIGDVGSGKTTLCRQIIRNFAADPSLETHLLFDPAFDTPHDFLLRIAHDLTGRNFRNSGLTEWQLKEEIKNYLFKKGVEEGRTVILIIDEGQKIPFFSLEILREFLNYETNQYKLLQIVVFAQKEFEIVIRRFPNFSDRINLHHLLEPLGFSDTRKMIKFRVDKCREPEQTDSLFTGPALWAIFRLSGGFPRKIINLCHLSLLSAIIQNRSRVDWFLVRSCARGDVVARGWGRRSLSWSLLLVLILAAGVWTGFSTPTGDWIRNRWPFGENSPAASTMAANIPATPASSGPVTERAVTETASARERPGTPGNEFRQDTAPPSGAGQAPDNSSVSPIIGLASDTASDTGRREEKTADLEPVESGKPEQPAVLSSLHEAVNPDAPEGPIQPAIPDAAHSPEIGSFKEKPSSLGEIVLQRGEFVAQLMRIVYGSSDMRLFAAVKEANPHIKDLGVVEIGQRVRFPLPDVQTLQPSRTRWRVQIAQTDSLREAVDLLRKFAQVQAGARIVPYWSDREGLMISVVTSESFVDETGARQRAAQLPSPWNQTAAPTMLWTGDRLFYSEILKD